jgi:hypothetical protein
MSVNQSLLIAKKYCNFTIAWNSTKNKLSKRTVKISFNYTIHMYVNNTRTYTDEAKKLWMFELNNVPGSISWYDRNLDTFSINHAQETDGEIGFSKREAPRKEERPEGIVSRKFQSTDF